MVFNSSNYLAKLNINVSFLWSFAIFINFFLRFFLNLSYACLVFIVIFVNRNSYFKQRPISSNLCYCSKSLKSLPVYVYFVKLTEKRNVSLSYFRQTSTLPELTNQTPVNVRKWFVLTSSFFNLFITGGFPFNMSVLFVEFLKAFGKSKAETSLVQSVCTGVYSIGGKNVYFFSLF